MLKNLTQINKLLDVLKNHTACEEIISDARLTYPDFRTLCEQAQYFASTSEVDIIAEWLSDGVITEEQLWELCVSGHHKVVDRSELDDLEDKIEEAEEIIRDMSRIMGRL